MLAMWTKGPCVGEGKRSQQGGRTCPMTHRSFENQAAAAGSRRETSPIAPKTPDLFLQEVLNPVSLAPILCAPPGCVSTAPLDSTLLTSLPKGIPLPRAHVRPITLATKVLRVRYSFSTTPRRIVFISGMPEPGEKERDKGMEGEKGTRRGSCIQRNKWKAVVLRVSMSYSIHHPWPLAMLAQNDGSWKPINSQRTTGFPPPALATAK